LDVEFPFDLKFIEPFAQRGAGDAQQLGGMHLVALGFLHGVDDEFALHGGQGLIERWVLSWGADAEVTQPRELRDRLRIASAALASLYG